MDPISYEEDPFGDEGDLPADDAPEPARREGDGPAPADRSPAGDPLSEDKRCPECGEEILLQYDTQSEGLYWRCDHCGLNLCDDFETAAYPDTCIPMDVVEKALREEGSPRPKPKRKRRKGKRGGS